MSERFRGIEVPKKEMVVDKPLGVGEKIRELKVPRFNKNGLNVITSEVLVDHRDYDRGGQVPLGDPNYKDLNIENVLSVIKWVAQEKQVIFEKPRPGRRKEGETVENKERIGRKGKNRKR